MHAFFYVSKKLTLFHAREVKHDMQETYMHTVGTCMHTMGLGNQPVQCNVTVGPHRVSHQEKLYV